MKIVFALASLFAVVSFPTIASAHFATSTEEHIIYMTDTGPSAANIQIEVGESVTFINSGQNKHWPASNLHPTHTLYPGSNIKECGTDQAAKIFDACRGLLHDESYTFEFDQPGVWKFHDHLYAQFGGTITVTGEATATSAFPESKRSLWQRFTDWIKAKIATLKVRKDSSDIFINDVALTAYMQKYGPSQTVTHLHELEATLGSCHQAAHRSGHIAYKLYGEKAFIEYNAYCQSGYYHGVMEEYLQENGAEHLTESLGSLCKSDLNDFFAHQCVHGIGHGIMAWENYDLPAALAICDKLPERQSSCYTGVFMENLGAQLAKNGAAQNVAVGDTDTHYTTWLSEDPQYPCNIVADKYKDSCYFLQTSRMLQIFGSDFPKISAACAKVPAAYQIACFASMGRDVGGNYPTDPAAEIKQCRYVENADRRIDCLNGAVQNSFWDPSGADQSISFCKLLTDGREKDSCYDTLFGRAPQIMSGAADLDAFCQKVEPSFVAHCKEVAH